MTEPAARRSASEIISRLEADADPENVVGMARYGISTEGTLGVSMPVIRATARDVKREAGRGEEGAAFRHEVAAALWGSGVHEARILAALIDVPGLVTREQMEAWVGDFDSWDVCDQVCSSLFDKTDVAYELTEEWPERDEEFVKRAGFVLMAALAVHDKTQSDEAFLAMLPTIEAHATDERNFVKKAVNWALRGIGKRDMALNAAAVVVAGRLAESDDRVERWVGKDAFRELTSEKTLSRIRRRAR